MAFSKDIRTCLSFDDVMLVPKKSSIASRHDVDLTVYDWNGDPLKIASRQDFGPIWVYHFGQGRFMYYLAFLNGKLQRIASAPCNPNRPECLDIR